MNEFINTWLIKNYSKLVIKLERIKSPDWDDILQEVFLQFLEMDKDFVIDLICTGGATNYIGVMFWRNCNNKTSPYQYKYNKMKYVSCDEFDEVNEDVCKDFIMTIDLDDIKKSLIELETFFIDKLIFKEYIDRKLGDNSYSFKQMSIESGLTEAKLRKRYEKVRDELKEYYKK